MRCYLKYELLLTTKEKKLVVVAGSNCAYGLDSPVLDAGLNNEYKIINYGTNSYSPAVFYIEMLGSHMNKGDILLLAPEINTFQYGKNIIMPVIWHFFEMAYEAFSEVDLRNYKDMFNSFAEFNNTRMNMEELSYETYSRETVNYYGDYSMLKEGHTSSYDPYTITTHREMTTDYVTDYADKLNFTLDPLIDKGIKVYSTFLCVNRLWLSDRSLERGMQEEYMNAVRDNIHTTLVSDIADYIMEPECFYNSHEHLNSAAARERTERLVADLLPYMIKDGYLSEKDTGKG